VQARSVLVWGAIAASVGFAIVDLLDIASNAGILRSQFGVDYQLYMDTAGRWLHGGSYFQPYQVAGPYQISAGDILYPPVALLLFLPFTVLPAFLWWVIPGGAIAWALRRLRPERVVWPLLAACALWPTSPLKVLTGNPVIWAVAALALGVVYGWPSLFVLIKPSLFPFALVGARRRAWWVALGLFIAVSVPFGSLWIDWIHSVLNSQGGGLAYSSLEIPMLAFPVIAWAGRGKPQQAIDSPG
jgi:hypothetical protein